MNTIEIIKYLEKLKTLQKLDSSKNLLTTIINTIKLNSSNKPIANRSEE